LKLPEMSTEGEQAAAAEEQLKEYAFNDVKDGLENGTIILVDVRGEDEYAAGYIPNSVNIPLPSIIETFRDDYNDFETKYGFNPKADVGTPKSIVFSCKSGRRAEVAITNLQQNGFPHLNCIYRGSFSDWEANNGPIQKK